MNNRSEQTTHRHDDDRRLADDREHQPDDESTDGNAPDLVLQDRVASVQAAAADGDHQPHDARRLGSKDPFD